ncbi:hypothetical protein ACW2QC_04420 [Virgibacillus sp. FSP13]
MGTIFGLTYLIMLIITMGLQTGHIVHIVKQEQNKDWEERSSWMMATLSGSFEGLTGVFKSIWTLFLGIAFWENDNFLLASLMFLFSLLFFYF